MDITIMKIPGATDTRSLTKLLDSQSYNNTTGVGFKEVEIEGDFFVTGIAAKRTPIFIRVYDPASGSLVEREEFLLHEVFFRADCKKRLVEVYGKSSEVKRLIDVFHSTGRRELRLEQILVKTHDVLLSMKAAEKKYEIRKLDIKEFSSEKGVVGNFDIHSIDPARAWDFVKKYKKQIKTSTVVFLDTGIEASIHIFDNGRFRIAARPRTSNDVIVSALKAFLLSQ